MTSAEQDKRVRALREDPAFAAYLDAQVAKDGDLDAWQRDKLRAVLATVPAPEKGAAA